MTATHWVRWHEKYDGETPSARRLAIVQRWIGDVVSGMPAGQIRIVSMCAGDGRDLVGALAGHARRADVEGRLVELDPTLARRATDAIEATGLRGAVRQADAVIWTRHRREPDVTPAIRRWFAGVGFDELTFEPVPDSVASVGAHRLVGPPLPFEPSLRLFEFLPRD